MLWHVEYRAATPTMQPTGYAGALERPNVRSAPAPVHWIIPALRHLPT